MNDTTSKLLAPLKKAVLLFLNQSVIVPLCVLYAQIPSEMFSHGEFPGRWNTVDTVTGMKN